MTLNTTPSSQTQTSASPPEGDKAVGLRIGDTAARAGVSPRTLRYYEELGLLAPSGRTAGGERRYEEADLVQLRRILELRDVLGMNLDEIKVFLDSERRLDEVRIAYRVNRDLDTDAAALQRRELLGEALELNERLVSQLDAKLARMGAFRSTMVQNAKRCREMLAEIGRI